MVPNKARTKPRNLRAGPKMSEAKVAALLRKAQKLNDEISKRNKRADEIKRKIKMLEYEYEDLWIGIKELRSKAALANHVYMRADDILRIQKGLKPLYNDPKNSLKAQRRIMYK